MYTPPSPTMVMLFRPLRLVRTALLQISSLPTVVILPSPSRLARVSLRPIPILPSILLMLARPSRFSSLSLFWMARNPRLLMLGIPSRLRSNPLPAMLRPSPMLARLTNPSRLLPKLPKRFSSPPTLVRAARPYKFLRMLLFEIVRSP